MVRPTELTQAQYERIEPLLPVQRGNVKLVNLQVLLYMAEQGCKWRALPERYGPLGTRSTCGSTAGPSRACWSGSGRRWSRTGSWLRPPWTARSSSCIRTARGCRKRGRQAIGRSRGGWTTNLHLLARDDRGALAMALSPGQAAATAGRELLERHSPREDGPALLMDRACEDDRHSRARPRLAARRPAEAQPPPALALQPCALQAV